MAQKMGKHCTASEREQRLWAENLRLNAELEHRVQEFQALLDVLPVGVGIALDPECRRIRGNHWATDFLQLPASANMSTTAPPDERAAYKVCRHGREIHPQDQPMRQACAANRVIRDAEEDIVLPDGKIKTVSVSAAPLHDQSGNVRGCVGVFWDVTERKRALHDLQVIVAIRRVLDGKVYLSETISETLLHRAVGEDGQHIERSPLDALSDRELEVLRLTGRGLKTQEIAAQLRLSVKTVETYRARIRAKLDLSDGA